MEQKSSPETDEDEPTNKARYEGSNETVGLDLDDALNQIQANREGADDDE